MLHKYLLGLFLFISFLIPQSSFAITPPAIYINDLTVAETTLEQGDSVNGTFELLNASRENVSDISYVVRIVGNHDATGLWSTEYASDTFGPLFLAGGDVATISFSFPVPQGVVGDDLGVEVQATVNGLPLGWDEVPILIQGVAAPVTFTDSYIEYKDEVYGVAVGITVDPEESASLVTLVDNNDEGQAYTVTPVISLYRSHEGGNARPDTRRYAPVTLAPGKDAEVSLSLSTNYESGVYTGALIFVTADGMQVGEKIPLRFIIGGDSAVIHFVQTDRESVRTWDEIGVKVSFSGTPYDLVELKEQSPIDAELQIRLTDEGGEEVASGEYPVVVEGTVEHTATLVATRTAQKLFAEAVLIADGKVLASLSSAVSGDGALFSDGEIIINGYLALIGAFLALIGLLLIVAKRYVLLGASLFIIGVIIPVVLYVFASVSAPTANVSTQSGSVSQAQLTGFALGFNFNLEELMLRLDPNYLAEQQRLAEERAAKEKAELEALLARILDTNQTPPGTFTVVEHPWQKWVTDKRINVRTEDLVLFLNSPGPLPLQPGEEFYVQGSVRSTQCYNAPQNLTVEAELGGTKLEQSRLQVGHARQSCPGGQATAAGTCLLGQAAGWNPKVKYVLDRFSVGPFTAPDEPGSHAVKIGAGYNWKDIGDGVLGYVTVVVETDGSAPTVPTIDGPTTGNVQTSYAFTFSANDPDNDQIRYGVDWDNDGERDEWYPSSGYVASGESQEVSRSFASSGPHRFQVFAEDEGGSRSVWQPHTITIAEPGVCQDGIDNDGDGHIDYPADGGCLSGAGGSEVSQCQDGIDNDGNGVIDDADGGCADDNDNSERTAPQCQDGVDNNGDGKIDYPDDPACDSPDDEEVSSDAELSLTADPALVHIDARTQLTWTAVNVSSCTLSGDNGDSWTFSEGNDSRLSSPLTSETTFTLSCLDSEDVTQSVNATVKLIPRFDEE